MNTEVAAVRRALVAPIAIGAVFAFVFVWLFAAALHLPRPHDLPVGLVAPDPVAMNVEAALATSSPGAFTFVRYATVDDARAAIEQRSVNGAFVPASGQATILVAGAAGDASAAVITAALGGVARGLGLQVVVEDVRPYPAQDPRGVIAFFLVIGVSVSALLYQAIAFALGSTARVRRNLVALTVFAVVAGLASGAAVQLVTGFDDGYWLLSALCALAALAVALTVAALQRLVGMVGTAIAGLIVVLFGIACSGGMAGPYFLPDFFRAFSPYLPPSAAMDAARGTLYFDGAALVDPVAVLVAWAVGAIVVLGVAGSWTRSGFRQGRAGLRQLRHA